MFETAAARGTNEEETSVSLVSMSLAVAGGWMGVEFARLRTLSRNPSKKLLLFALVVTVLGGKEVWWLGGRWWVCWCRCGW